MFKDDLITEQFKRDIYARIEAGEITQEEVANASTTCASNCCAAPLTNNIRCSLCQKEHIANGTEFIIDQDNCLHLIRREPM